MIKRLYLILLLALIPLAVVGKTDRLQPESHDTPVAVDKPYAQKELHTDPPAAFEDIINTKLEANKEIVDTKLATIDEIIYILLSSIIILIALAGFINYKNNGEAAKLKQEMQKLKDEAEKDLKSIEMTMSEVDRWIEISKNKFIEELSNLKNKGENKEQGKNIDIIIGGKPQSEYTAKDYFLKAYKARSENRLEDACRDFEKAIALDPYLKEAYYNWGNALSDLAKLTPADKTELYEKAIDKYAKATNLDPNYKEAYYNWGNALSDLAKLTPADKTELYEKAIDKYEKVTNLDPNDKEAYYNWGVVLADLAKLTNKPELYNKAIEKFEKATNLDPYLKEAYNNWGNALLGLAKLTPTDKTELYNKAIDKYEKAIALDSNYTAAHFNKSHAYSMLGDKENTFASLQTALECNKKTGEISRELLEAANNFDLIKGDPRFNKLLDTFFPH